MKKLLKRLSVLFAVILAVSVVAFADEVEEEKTYIVYPNFTLFTEQGNPAGFYVVTQEELDELLELEMVESYRETITGELLGDVEEYDPHWDIETIKAFQAHNMGHTGDGIKVGIIDSGIDCEHPNFLEISITESSYNVEGTRVIYGYNYKDGTKDPIITETENGQRITLATKDTFGHGTAIAGKVGAGIQSYYWDGKNLNQNWGISGTAPGVTLVPLKVTDGKYVNEVPVINAIYGAVNDFDCDVINISIGFYEDVPEMKAAIDYAVGKGVTVVASVGNDGTDRLMYPAAYGNVIGVGATDKEGNVWVNVNPAGGSQQNESVFITAPGADVVATWSYDAEGEFVLDEKGEFVLDEQGNKIEKKLNFKRVTGTSLSAPLVTGAVALLKQANPDLTPAEIMSILAASATDDAKGDGYDTAYGHGILNVAAAIDLVLDENRAPSTVTYRVTADDELLSGAVTVANYTVGNIGSHPLGEIFTAKAEPTYKLEDGTEYEFAYWANGNGTHVSGKATYTFAATSNFTLRAVYDKVSAGEAPAEKKVEFWNGNGVLLGTQNVNAEGKISTANIPETDAKMTGYTFAGWLDDEKNEFSADSVLEKNLTRVVAQFTDKEKQYSVTFDDEADSTEIGVYGKKVTYTASGKGFDYWELDGKIVSYDPTIEIALWGAGKTLTAEYNDDTAVAKPTVVLDTGVDDANFLIYSVPDDYKIIDAGIVFGKENEKPRVASFRSKASVKKLPEDGFGQFTSLPGDLSHTVARGYLIFEDPDNVIRVIYSY